MWATVDGKSSVEQIIVGFSRAHRLNLREAEISVMAFLRTLMQRNLIALTTDKAHAPKPHRPPSKSRKRKPRP